MADPANLKVTFDKTREIVDALTKLSKTCVMVGIPSDSEQPHIGAGQVGTEKRVSGTINNAALGYIHENGSPAANIPPRPWLVPGVRSVQTRTISYLEQAAKLSMEGNASAADRALNAAGLTAVVGVKNYVVAGIPPPLAPATIAARRRRSTGSSYRRQATGAADVTPLIDTAQMLNSVSYVIRKK